MFLKLLQDMKVFMELGEKKRNEREGMKEYAQSWAYIAHYSCLKRIKHWFKRQRTEDMGQTMLKLALIPR